MDGPEKAPRTGFHPSPSQTVQFLFHCRTPTSAATTVTQLAV